MLSAKKYKKIDYHKKKYSNPYFRRQRRKKIKIKPWSWRTKLIIFEIIIVAVSLIWFFCFSNIFTVDNINVSGAERISAKSIKELSWQQTRRRRFLFGSQSRLVLFNKNLLIKTLNRQYCLDSLAVKKKFPGTLIIEFKEKAYLAIWHELDSYYYIDGEGNIISEVGPLEIQQKDYPLIDNRGEGRVAGKKLNDSGEDISYAIKLFEEFKNNRHGFKIERFILENENNTIKMAIEQGPVIHFDTREEIEKQATKLQTIINEKLKDDFKQKEYIDLRFGDRVYYR